MQRVVNMILKCHIKSASHRKILLRATSLRRILLDGTLLKVFTRKLTDRILTNIVTDIKNSWFVHPVVIQFWLNEIKLRRHNLLILKNS